MSQKIVPNLWFDGQAEEAAEFYTSVFKDSRIVSSTNYNEAGPGEPGSTMVVEFELNGQRFIGIDGGPQFKFNEALSLQVTCEDQDEVDYYWEKLTDGGEEGPCGWLKDRFGLSWQVTPKRLTELVAQPDKDRAKRAMEAMFGMKKLDIAELERAAEGVPAA